MFTKVKKKLDSRQVKIKINIEQGCEMKVFNCIYEGNSIK